MSSVDGGGDVRGGDGCGGDGRAAGADVLAFLMGRASVHAQLLEAPAPDSSQVQALLDVAMRAPDHGGLTPWRYVVVEGEGRRALGALLRAAQAARAPGSTEAELDAAASKPLRAPMVIVAVAHVHDHPKVPASEQLLAAGASVTLLLLAAEAMGFGASWLSGPNAYGEAVHAGLGLGSNEQVIGLVHIGTPRRERGGDKARASSVGVTRRWPA